MIRNKGFTLVEILVVIAILAILILLGMPKFAGYIERAELTRIQHDVRVMESMIEEDIANNEYKNYDEFQQNNKKLGTLILADRLFEKEGHAKNVEYIPPTNEREINANVEDESLNLVNNDNSEINNIELLNGTDEIEDVSLRYKIIPDKYTKTMKSKLKGTFYTNENGKVYYESNKPIPTKSEPLACSAIPLPDYTFEHEIGKIVKYHGNAEHLIIPSYFLVDGQCWPVRIIGKGAFMQGGYKSIVIPDTVIEIEEDAFKNNNLDKIYIPGSVGNIDNEAFDGNRLPEIIYGGSKGQVSIGTGSGGYPQQGGGNANIIYRTPTPKDVGVIFRPGSGGGNGGSGGGGNSGTITKGGNSGYIPPYLLIDDVEHKVTEIAEGAYQGKGLITVILPETLEVIDDYAFSGNQLIGITIPNGVKHIGHYAFSFNEVEKVGNIPGPLKKATIKTVIMKETEQFNKIDKYGNILENGEKLDYLKSNDENKGPDVRLLNHIWVTSIGNIVIDEEYIGENEPEDSDIPESTNNYEFDISANKITGYLGEDKELIIPSTMNVDGKSYKVKTIGEGAFRGKDLTKVTIPNSVEIIEKEAFAFNKLIEVNLSTSLNQIQEKAFAANRNQFSKLSIERLTYANKDYRKDLDDFGYIIGDGDLWDKVEVNQDSFDILLTDDRRYDHDYGTKGVPIVWDKSGTNKATIINDTSSNVTATEGKTHGKWYWEVDIDSISGERGLCLGYKALNLNDEAVNTSYWWDSLGQFLWYHRGADRRFNYSTPYGISTVSVLLDLDNNTIEFWRNGVSAGKVVHVVEDGYKYYPQLSTGTVAYRMKVETTTNFGVEPFKYNIPEGYKPYDYMNSDPVNLAK